MSHFDSAATKFEQAPACGKVFASNHSGGNQIKALAADCLLRLEAEGLGAVGKEIRARDFAFDQHRMASALPADGVGHLTANAGLFGEHDSTAVASQPADGFFD
jgi:hypothetical protein